MRKEEILICECGNTEHQVLFLYDIEDNDDKVTYMHTHLVKYGFFARLKYAIKYIFGYQSKYGAFDEFIFKSNDIHKLEKVIAHLKNDNCGIDGKVTDIPNECSFSGNVAID